MRHEHEKTLRAVVLSTAEVDTEMSMSIEMRARDEILANSSTTPKRTKEMGIRTQTRDKNGRFATQSIMRKMVYNMNGKGERETPIFSSQTAL